MSSLCLSENQTNIYFSPCQLSIRFHKQDRSHRQDIFHYFNIITLCFENCIWITKEYLFVDDTAERLNSDTCLVLQMGR